jgi:DNA repair photolyase
MEYVPAKTILSRTKNRAWFGTDYNMNLYRGCCHGCIYCDSRSDCYRIEEFDRVRVKQDALRILRDELARKPAGLAAMGAMSDPYNPFEENLQLTRRALTLLDAYEFGVALATKSDLVARDADILVDIRAHSPVLVKVTVTTCDDALAAKLEPQAPPPSRRLRALETLSAAGIFTGVLLMPVLPFLEDSAENVRTVVHSAAKAGARFVYPYFGVTLRQNQRTHYLDELEARFPGQGLRERYLVRYGGRYDCRSPQEKALWQTFCAACAQYGLLYKMQDIVAASRLGYQSRQTSLFPAP